MFYEPFVKIKEVEPFFGHSINLDGMEMTVIGATVNPDTKALWIQAVDLDGRETSMPSMNWFYTAKYMGHRFGRKVKDEEI